MAKTQYYGTGRRKSSIARVRLVPGTGKITVNKKPLDEYLALVDWSGRILRPDKPGAIQGDLPSILHRLGIEVSAFSRHVGRSAWGFGRAIGTVDRLHAFAKQCGHRFVKGVGAARILFGNPCLKPS